MPVGNPDTSTLIWEEALVLLEEFSNLSKNKLRKITTGFEHLDRLGTMVGIVCGRRNLGYIFVQNPRSKL